MTDDMIEEQSFDDEDEFMTFQPEDTCACGSGVSYDDCCGLYD